MSSASSGADSERLMRALERAEVLVRLGFHATAANAFFEAGEACRSMAASRRGRRVAK